MKEDKTNREDVLLRIAMLLFTLFFWGTIVSQIMKLSKLVIICGIMYSIVNMYISYGVFKKIKPIIVCFCATEAILLIPIIIIVTIQAII